MGGTGLWLSLYKNWAENTHRDTHTHRYKYIAGKNTSRYCYANLCILRNRHWDRLLPRSQTWSTVEPTLYLACISLWKLLPHFLPHPREINRIFVRCIWFYEIVQYLSWELLTQISTIFHSLSYIPRSYFMSPKKQEATEFQSTILKTNTFHKWYMWQKKALEHWNGGGRFKGL